jgi:hypothetical protein
MTQLPSYDPAAETRAVLHSISTPTDVSPIIANLNRIVSYPPIYLLLGFRFIVARRLKHATHVFYFYRGASQFGHQVITRFARSRGLTLKETSREAARCGQYCSANNRSEPQERDSVPVHKKFIVSDQSGFIGARQIIVRKHRRRKVHGGAEAHQPASRKEACSAKPPILAYRRPACGGNPCAECLHAAPRKAGETSVFRLTKWPRGILENQISIARCSIMLTDVTRPPRSFTRDCS